jgi:predicted DNA-binding ribbon-helix-helix protein
MRKAKHTRPVSISIEPAVYDQIKEITDQQEISIAEWFRSVAEDALRVPSNRNADFASGGSEQ